ncbi:glycosyltransferase [Microbacterium sp. zg.B48]|uniref:glycosyltransferase family 2 protein n=1 Tax=Microbacterium sp. zg.B48 TaxID=2969408 RepID=UPI00214C21BF|nr:glycosyltransferase [Microbacterium sp. zg.B48]MCR2763291.1 glycosyltransferase [Microbacterium sp. zg.B48]
MTVTDACLETGAEARGDVSHAPAAPATATVAVCTRDRPDLLTAALTALQAALPTDTRILVVDSGSRSPDTSRVARSANVDYVRSDVPGLSIARNLALASSLSDCVVFTDDDCIVEPGFLAPLLAPFASAAVGATTGTLRDATAGGRAPVGVPPQTLRRTRDGLDAGHGALMAFRRETLQGLGGFDPLLGAGRRFGGAEDMDALCRVLHAGFEVVRVPDAVVTHVYTRSDEDYLRLNDSYGLGIGAMCAKWLRTHRTAGATLTGLVLRRGLSRYVRRFGSARTRRGQSRYLRAVARGLIEARRIPLQGRVFADLTPPQSVPAAQDASDGATTERATG